MKTIKKLLSFLLSAQIFIFSLSGAVYAEENIFAVSSANNEAVTGIYGSIAGPEGDSDFNAGIALMSLLPMDEENDIVFIDRSSGNPEKLGVYDFYVSEAFSRNLTLGTSGEYEKLLFSTDDKNYRPVEMNDVISFDSISYYSTTYGEYGKVIYANVYFMVGYTADDQLDNSSTTKYKVKVYFKPFMTNFLESTDFQLYNESGTEIKTYQNYVNESFYSKEYFVSNQILPGSLGENEHPGLRLVLPSGYSSANTAVYEGTISDETGLSSASNITASVLGNGYKLDGIHYESSFGNVFTSYIYLTFVITNPNGNRYFIPIRYTVSPVQTFVVCSCEPYYGSSKLYYNGSESDGIPVFVYEAESFEDIGYKIGASLRYFDEASDNYIWDSSKVYASCIGYYATLEDMAMSGAVNIKNELFTDGTDYTVDFSKCSDISGQLVDGTEVKVKEIIITTVDTDGFIYHNTVSVGIVEKLPEPEYVPEPEAPSDSTYFSVYCANKVLPNENGSAPYYEYYKVSSDDDSYYRNGFQTVFILDNGNPVPDGTVIYPTFYKGTEVKIFTSEGIQTSKYTPLTFESGKAVQYSASAENGVNLKNYWVTFVTQQSGPKLFVNAVNAEDNRSENGKAKREVLLNSSYDFHHDIFFANIGDKELTGINVSLSSDTRGVKLDPYWTIIDTSIRKLNPFTTTSASAINNIAKIRLIPENEDEFAPISGTLTISTDNGGSVDIELTGIAGVPRIVTDKLNDGVKYVPYSHVIMTNSMYDTDVISFSISSGALPKGIELKPNGELYGIPLEAGEFTFTVQAKYEGNSELSSYDSTDTHKYTLMISDNSDENVNAVNEDSQGYSLQERVSKYITVYYSSTISGAGAGESFPIIDRIEIDSDLFWSEGSYSTEFMDFYIDGYKLTEGTDYTAEEGSTKITVKDQTFSHIGISGEDVPHTLAGEFRTDNRTNELKRSAQNVYLKYINVEDDGNGGNPGVSTGGNHGGSTGGGSVVDSGGTIAPVIEITKTDSTVSAYFTVVDAEGNPISDLLLELHSTPMYARTDSNGIAKFEFVEFGKHTLYITSLTTGKKVSKSFIVESDSAAEIKDNVITAKGNDPVYVTVKFNGNEIELLSGIPDNIEAGAGISNIPNILNDSQGIVWIAVVTAIAAIVLVLIIYKRRKDIFKIDKNSEK